MFQPYPETADNIQTVKANPGNKWVRSLGEKKCQFVAVGLHGAYQNTNAAFLFRQGASSETELAQGLLSHLGHGQEGSKAEGAAVVRSSGSSWGLGPSCPPSLALTTSDHSRKGLPCSTCESLQDLLVLAAF